jgi:hypothetical protein
MGDICLCIDGGESEQGAKVTSASVREATETPYEEVLSLPECGYEGKI